jgi:ubiquinone/menaquinone biosynthesis C-methylase UbiE
MVQTAFGMVRPVRRWLARLYRRWRPIRLQHALCADECQVELAVLRQPLQMPKNGTHPFTLRLLHRAGYPLSPHGPRPVALAYRWLSKTPTPITLGGRFVPLPQVIYPGQVWTLPVQVTAPDCLGDHEIEFDLIQQPNQCFSEFGRPLVTAACHVTSPVSQEIDYPRVYATADLNRDYWTVVGPPTQAEFERLGQVKLQMLQGLGLTPNSRVLDVGCGTGLLAATLATYLSDQGAYYGTDVGREGIAFCRKHYRRPNFFFLTSAPTRLPLDRERFDLATFFSVFTHTYPDETALLLAEAKRLLAPGGFILADFFTSPLVERHAGNRGAVENNPEHLARLIDLVGLQAETIDRGPWEQFAQRRFLKLSVKTTG